MDLKSSVQYRSCIEPDMKLVPGSSKDYITRNGEVFTNINHGKKDEIKLFQKKTFINKHKVVSKPHKGLYFRYLSEYNEKGFVL